MKIIFSTDQIYLHGGIEKVMATKADYFAKLPDTEVYILTTEQLRKPPRYPLDSKVKMLDMNVNYNRTKSYFSKENLIKAIKHFREQKKIFKTLKPDVIISPNYNFDHYWLPFICSEAKKIKERHSSRFYEEKQRKTASIIGRIKFWFSDWFNAKYDYIVVLNDDEKKYIKSQNAVVIPNPIEITEIVGNPNGKQVIAAGRIAPVKRFDDLIKSWEIINKRFPDWQLHIYGDDYADTKSALEKLIKERSLEDKIIFKESVENLLQMMSDYSICTMSSETECFPMVLLEALSTGIPIVSYDCPNGPRHIITNREDGLLAEYKNIDDLATKLMQLISDAELRTEMGRKAKINVKRFEISQVMRMWNELLNLNNV